MIYLQLFISFLIIGITGFGGGYAMLSLIQNEVVVKHGWITATEFADIVAISQMTPGPISINCATYIGYTTTGSVWGSALATFGVCFPSLFFMLLGSYFFVKLNGNRYVSQIMRSLRPVVIGLILSAALLLMNKDSFAGWQSYLIFVFALVAGIYKVNPIIIIIISGVLGSLLF